MNKYGKKKQHEHPYFVKNKKKFNNFFLNVYVLNKAGTRFSVVKNNLFEKKMFLNNCFEN